MWRHWYYFVHLRLLTSILLSPYYGHRPYLLKKLSFSFEIIQRYFFFAIMTGVIFYYKEGNLKSYAQVLKIITWAQQFSLTCELSWQIFQWHILFLFCETDLFSIMPMLKELNFSTLLNFIFLLHFSGFYILEKVARKIWYCKIYHN